MRRGEVQLSGESQAEQTRFPLSSPTRNEEASAGARTKIEQEALNTKGEATREGQKEFPMSSGVEAKEKIDQKVASMPSQRTKQGHLTQQGAEIAKHKGEPIFGTIPDHQTETSEDMDTKPQPSASDGEQLVSDGEQEDAMFPMCVRRLTPTECERLQGFPDGWTCLCLDSET